MISFLHNGLCCKAVFGSGGAEAPNSNVSAKGRIRPAANKLQSRDGGINQQSSKHVDSRENGE